jgi:hypothetical protein
LPGTGDRENAAGKITTQTKDRNQAAAVCRPAPAHPEVPRHHERQTSAVNVYFVESNGSLIRTNNTRISLYGSVFMFNHTPHIGDKQQYNIFCMYRWKREFLYLYKAFYRKNLEKIKKKYISPP